MTPAEALQNLYAASRLINSTADTHEALRESHAVLLGAIQPRDAVPDATE